MVADIEFLLGSNVKRFDGLTQPAIAVDSVR